MQTLYCPLCIAYLVQSIMALVSRCSLAGRVCAGEFLTGGKASLEMAKYYKMQDGLFMMASPISQIVFLCCGGCVFLIISMCCLSVAVASTMNDLQ